MDIRKIIQAVRQRKWLFLITFLLSLCVVVLVPQAGSSIQYQSSAKILLTPSSQPASFGDRRSMGDPGSWLSDEATLRELVTSERLLSRVLQTTGLKINWLDLREEIKLEPLSSSYGRSVTLFSLGCVDDSPKRAQQISEALAQEFVSHVEELSAREFASTRRFLEELVAEAKEKVESTEEKLLTITTAHADKAESDTLASSQNDLETERRKMREEVAMLETELGAMQSFLSGQSETPPWSVLNQDTGLRQLEGAVSEARLKLVELEQTYTQDNFHVVEQKSKLVKVQELYKSRLTNYVQSLNSEKARSVAEKRSRLTGVENRLSELRTRQLTPQQKRDVAKLERQLQIWEENHMNLVKQLYQARVVEQSSRRQGAITILENPFLGRPIKSAKQRGPLLIFLFGVPFSFIFAVVLVLGTEFLTASMRLLPRIESTLGLPILAVIPPVSQELAATWETYKREETMPRSEDI